MQRTPRRRRGPHPRHPRRVRRRIQSWGLLHVEVFCAGAAGRCCTTRLPRLCTPTVSAAPSDEIPARLQAGAGRRRCPGCRTCAGSGRGAGRRMAAAAARPAWSSACAGRTGSGATTAWTRCAAAPPRPRSASISAWVVATRGFNLQHMCTLCLCGPAFDAQLTQAEGGCCFCMAGGCGGGIP